MHAIRSAFLVSWGCCAGLLADGCAPPELGTAPYRAEVIDIVEFDGQGIARFAVVERELDLLANLDRLSGDQLEFIRGGRLTIEDGAGEVISGVFEGDDRPRLRYVAEEGVAVPQDYPSLVMLSAYHHFEQVFFAIEAIAGQPIDEVLGRASPMQVFFEPEIVQKGEVETTVTIKLNAFYNPEGDQFGLAQRSELERIPLAANPMVIAHEFGHAMFHRLFNGGVAETCAPASDDPFFPARFDHEYAISGLNEGFADFLSFVITGTHNPLQDLDHLVGDERNFVASSFTFDDLASDADDVCSGSFYCIGTLFARALFQTMVALGHDQHDAADRRAFAGSVFAALSGTMDAMRDLPAGTVPNPSDTVKACSRQKILIAPYDGALTTAFLHALAAGMPADTRPALCAALAENFGPVGFAPVNGSACAAGEETDR